MKRFIRPVAFTVLVCFLLNVILSDLAFGQSPIFKSSDKLAVASRFDPGISEPEIAHIAKIKAVIEGNLISFANKGELDLKKFIGRINSPHNGNSIFSAPDLAIFYQNPEDGLPDGCWT